MKNSICTISKLLWDRKQRRWYEMARKSSIALNTDFPCPSHPAPQAGSIACKGSYMPYLMALNLMALMALKSLRARYTSSTFVLIFHWPFIWQFLIAIHFQILKVYYNMKHIFSLWASFSWNSYIKEKHMIMKLLVCYNKSSSLLYCCSPPPSMIPISYIVPFPCWVIKPLCVPQVPHL